MGVEHGKDVFPGIFARRAVESREDKHGDLGAHAYAEQCASTREVENFEERAPDDDGGAYGVGKVEEALPLGAVQEALYEVAEFLAFSHVEC